MPVPIHLIILRVHINISVIIKMNILMLMNAHGKRPHLLSDHIALSPPPNNPLIK